jgi:hypothetical protein
VLPKLAVEALLCEEHRGWGRIARPHPVEVDQL